MYIYNIMKTKNIIYCAYTGVDLGMSTIGDVSCRHPTTLPELTSHIQPQ